MTATRPLSFGQEQLWFIEQFHQGLPTYYVPHAVRMRGALDVPALRSALAALVARHEPLRTRFVSDEDGRPAQVCDAPAEVPLAEENLALVAAGEREDRLREIAELSAVEPFRLAEGPVIRFRLVHLSAEEHVLLVVAHHIVFDALSAGVLLADLAALYGTAVTGAPSGLAPLTVQAADAALAERALVAGHGWDDLVGYWRRTLDRLQTVQLPTDRPRPVVVGHIGGVEAVNLGAGLLRDIRALSEREGTTPDVTLLAALHVLLHRYTGQDDIVVGTAAADRGAPELAPLIGFLVNTLPIRADLAGDPGFAELLGRVRAAVEGARAHRALPFAKLVEVVDVERDTSRAPVFQVATTFAEEVPAATAAGLTLTLEQVDVPAAKFDLDVAARVRDGELWLRATYDVGIFEAATARRMLGHLGVLLAGIVADPAAPLSRLPLLTEDELQRELHAWNDTATELPQVTIHEGFEIQAARAPGAVAAELGDETVTYGELNAQANRIARWLRGFGVEAESLVGVGMAPSPRRLAVLLGIMKAGGGYVPLDPSLPADRLAFMMQDTNMPVVVADAEGVAALPTGGAEIVDLGAAWDAVAEHEDTDPRFPVGTSNVAYVIYTSGSTGQPKGVVVEHRHAVNFLLGMHGPWGITAEDRILQFASLNFDVSVMDMFMTLMAGARAVLAAKETLLSPPRLADLIRDRKVTFACLPPAVVSLLTGEQFPDLRILLSAGEELSADLVRKWLRPSLHFYNGYGPTEAAIGTCFMEIDGSVFPPPIGRPKPNYQAYVLDPNLNPVPVGVVGELHVGGAGVTRGYLNAPEMTARRFIPDVFRPEVPRARLYKTGDLVRRNPDGTIVFVGRIDGQVKIRGLRVELGEVETAIVGYEGVAQAVAVVAEDRSGEKQLAGYVRSAPDGPAVNIADLRQHLAQRLPAYMVPTYLIPVDMVPLTGNGKIDRNALPPLDAAEADGEAEFVAPRTVLEAVLTDMYARLLNHEQVGVDTGFFELGGNSLQAMQLVTRLRAELAVDVDVTAVFLAPTAGQLTAFLRAKHGLDDMSLDEMVME